MLNSPSEKLCEAEAILNFVQHMTLEVSPEDSLSLDPLQVTGLYYVLQKSIDLISEANALITPGTTDKQAEAS